MDALETEPLLLDGFIEFLTKGPTEDQILAFRPSDRVQRRSQELLAKQNAVPLSDDEEAELDQLVQGELLVQLVSARIHARRTTRG